MIKVTSLQFIQTPTLKEDCLKREMQTSMALSLGKLRQNLMSLILKLKITPLLDLLLSHGEEEQKTKEAIKA